MGETVRSQNDSLDGFFLLSTDSDDSDTGRAPLVFRRRQSHVLQVRLVLLQLRAHVVVVVDDSFVNGLQRLGLEQHLLPQIAEVDEFRSDFFLHQLVPVGGVNDFQFFQLSEHLLHLDALSYEGGVLGRRRAFSNRGQVVRSLVCAIGKRPNKLDEDGLGLHVKHVAGRDRIHQSALKILDWRLPTAVQVELNGAIFLARDLRGSSAEFISQDPKVLLIVWRLKQTRAVRESCTMILKAHQCFDVLQN